MNEVLKEYLSTVNNLSMLEPKNLPLNLIISMSNMESEELFKTCAQLFVLGHNVPSKNKIVNLSEEEIAKGATTYAQAILERIRNR